MHKNEQSGKTITIETTGLAEIDKALHDPTVTEPLTRICAVGFENIPFIPICFDEADASIQEALLTWCEHTNVPLAWLYEKSFDIKKLRQALSPSCDINFCNINYLLEGKSPIIALLLALRLEYMTQEMMQQATDTALAYIGKYAPKWLLNVQGVAVGAGVLPGAAVYMPLAGKGSPEHPNQILLGIGLPQEFSYLLYYIAPWYYQHALTSPRHMRAEVVRLMEEFGHHALVQKRDTTPERPSILYMQTNIAATHILIDYIAQQIASDEDTLPQTREQQGIREWHAVQMDFHHYMETILEEVIAIEKTREQMADASAAENALLTLQLQTIVSESFARHEADITTLMKRLVAIAQPHVPHIESMVAAVNTRRKNHPSHTDLAEWEQFIVLYGNAMRLFVQAITDWDRQALVGDGALPSVLLQMIDWDALVTMDDEKKIAQIFGNFRHIPLRSTPWS